MPNRGLRPLSLTLIYVSEFLFNYPVSRNTSRRSNFSVTVAFRYAWYFTTQRPSICLRSILDYRLYLVCDFRFLGVADFPLGPTVDVSTRHSIPFYEALTHATRYMRLLNRYKNPRMHTSASKWSEDVISFSFLDDLQTRGRLVPASIHWAVPSVNSHSPVQMTFELGVPP